MTLEVPSTAYVLPEGVDPAAVLSFLATRVELTTDRPRTATWTIVDTADRRLRAEGIDLALAGGRGEATLTLREGPGGPRVTGRAGRHRRWLARDLPAGPLRDRLTPVIEMRALLPLAQVRAEEQALQVLNRDAKTVVRLSLITPAALDAAAEPVPVTPRLEVRGVLGYPRPVERLQELLTKEAGLVEATVGLADEVLVATGGDPDGIRTKVRVPMAPGDRTDKAALRVLRDLAGMVEANLPGTLADHDTEFLHDLRVAVRRSRSVLREMKGAFPPDELARQRATLRWIQAITGPTRDLDVQLLEWDGLAAGVPAERHAALAPVRKLLAQHRAAALRSLKRDLRGAEYRDGWAAYRSFLEGGFGSPGDRPDAKRPVAEVAGRRIRRVYARMVDMGTAITDDSPADELHDLRKRGKELRYLLELFGGLWPDDVVKPMVRTLKNLQNVLGTHQDREVQADHLRALADELAGQVGGPEALLVLGTLVDQLEAEQHAARAQFAERFADFAGKAQRKLVKGTFAQ
jgi:CHAD domain-containing protein